MQAATFEDFARNPVGRFVAGATFAHGCFEPRLWGLVLWGRPSAADARDLGRTLILELREPATTHASIVDASRLEGGDDGAFEALERYVTRYGPVLGAWVERLALVRPPGLQGAIVAGAYEVLPRPYPVMTFDAVDAALRWLERDLPASALAELHAAAISSSPLVEALRALLDRNLRGLAIADAAAALHTSERTLQRKLGEIGTTFQVEIAEARVRAAKRMLLDGDLPLTTIAMEIGCASVQHFNTLFKKRVGSAPSAFRRARR